MCMYVCRDDTNSTTSSVLGAMQIYLYWETSSKYASVGTYLEVQEYILEYKSIQQIDDGHGLWG